MQNKQRVFVAASPVHDYFVDVRAAGPVAAIESPELVTAPVGAMLLTDADDGQRGIVCAERVVGGWVMTGATP